MREYLNKVSMELLREYYYEAVGKYPDNKITKDELIDTIVKLYSEIF